jgi:hypothetical protein
MEVGKCTSKVIKELKQKDKVDGRFFHTSDTDEWYFCWNGQLQKLNLKGNSDVNSALAEVEKLIANANAAVSDAKKTATEAKTAAADAKDAAAAASAAAGKIENKADKSDVDAVEKEVELKADKSVVDGLSAKVDAIKVPSLEGYATEEFVGKKIAKIDIPDVPTKVSAFENDANYLTVNDADLKYAPIGSGGVDLSSYATKEFVGVEISKIDIPTKVSELENDANYLTEHQDISGKQDVISDLEEIRSNSKNALKEIPSEYVTETELEAKGYLTEHQLLDNYYTKEQIDAMIKEITDMIDVAIEKTNTILA